jgi:Tol biopolymer transport system component
MKLSTFCCVVVLFGTLAAPPGAAAYLTLRHLPRFSAQVERPQLISRESGRHGQPSVTANEGSIDRSGGRVIFYAGFEGRRGGIYIRDVGRQRTRRLTAGSEASIDEMGNRVVFRRNDSLYARDLKDGHQRMVSVDKQGAAPCGGRSGEASISGDGRYVAFISTCVDLLRTPGPQIPFGALGQGQVYVRDLRHGKDILVSRASGRSGAVGDFESMEPAISANGRFVAFTSEASNLAPGGLRINAVYLRDLRTGTLRLISRHAFNPSISANGRYVAFELSRLGHPFSIRVEDTKTGTLADPTQFSRRRIKVHFRSEATLSPDGRFLAFRAGWDHFGLQKLFVADLATHRVWRGAEVGIEYQSRLGFSSDGRFLIFDNYVPPDPEAGQLATGSGKVYRLQNPLLVRLARHQTRRRRSSHVRFLAGRAN